VSKKERDGPPSSDAEPARYEVGYGRPPRAHQFKPGESGNARGRPKGAKSEATILPALLNRKIEIREGGRVRKITVHEAILLRCVEDALKGNVKATSFLLNRYAAMQASETQEIDEMSKDEREVLESFVSRLEAELKEKG
jgi:Family of unknown function (DUF5681)